MAGPGKPVQKAAGDGQDGGESMRIDARLVQQLAELLDKNGLTEIEVADGDRRIRVGRGAAPVAAAPAPVPHALSPTPGGDAQPTAAAAEDVSGETIKSPMVGTAFLSPEPGSGPFIKVGDAVKAGDTLLIIEAMKVMNPITAPQDGVVKSILIADAHPVEFDQPLLVLG